MASADQLLPVGAAPLADEKAKDPERGMQALSVVGPATEGQESVSLMDRIEAILPGNTRIKKWITVGLVTAIVLLASALGWKFYASKSKGHCPDGYVEADSSSGASLDRRLMNKENCIKVQRQIPLVNTKLRQSKDVLQQIQLASANLRQSTGPQSTRGRWQGNVADHLQQIQTQSDHLHKLGRQRSTARVDLQQERQRSTSMVGLRQAIRQSHGQEIRPSIKQIGQANGQSLSQVLQAAFQDQSPNKNVDHQNELREVQADAKRRSQMVQEMLQAAAKDDPANDDSKEPTNEEVSSQSSSEATQLLQELSANVGHQQLVSDDVKANAKSSSETKQPQDPSDLIHYEGMEVSDRFSKSAQDDMSPVKSSVYETESPIVVHKQFFLESPNVVQKQLFLEHTPIRDQPFPFEDMQEQTPTFGEEQSHDSLH